ncbi:MAG: C40 family peptidase [Muribaculaceae bacterium]|nr:C40 family peptidase [Muribaculaceae bacterium]
MRQSKNILVLCVTLFTMCIISSCSSSKKTVVVDEFYEPIVVLSKTDTLSNKLEAEVQQWLGVPYKYGGQSKNGVDCSGLVVEIYKNVYGIKLYRASYEIYEKNCSKINCEELGLGDLVFFNTHKKNNRINHVGLYLKNDKFVHSSTSKGVIISDMTEPYYKKCFIGAGRVKKD